MPAADSPTHQSPGYIPESDPEEEPEERKREHFALAEPTPDAYTLTSQNRGGGTTTHTLLIALRYGCPSDTRRHTFGPTQLRQDLNGFADMLDPHQGRQTSRKSWLWYIRIHGIDLSPRLHVVAGIGHSIDGNTAPSDERGPDYTSCRYVHGDGCLCYQYILRAISLRTTTIEEDYRRQRQLVETLKIVKSLKAQMIELQRQQGPAKVPAEPELPEEAGSSS
ncbi:hypothetical protein Tco_0153358 [Tanacetum coccineum]